MAASNSGSDAGDGEQTERVEEDIIPESEDDQPQERAVNVQVPQCSAMDKLSPLTCMQLTWNLAENWERFKQRFNIHLAACGTGGDDEKLKDNIPLHVIGEDALDIYKTACSWIKQI